MNCPKCGGAIPEGKAYCSNPSCGAMLTGQPQESPEPEYQGRYQFVLKPGGGLLLKVIVFLLVFLAMGYFKSR